MKNSKLTILSIVCAEGMGMLPFYVMPMLIGGIIGIYGISEGTAGIVFSFELCAMAIASILMSMNLHKNILKKMACLGIIIVVLGNIASYYSASLIPIAGFVAIRILVGLAEGCLLAAANGVAAGMAQPDRVYAVMGFGEVVPVLIAFLAIPMFIESMGSTGGYIALGALALITLPFILAIPNKPPTKNNDDEQETSNISAGTNAFNKLVAFRMMLGFACFVIGANALWAYNERIGLSTGLDLEGVATVLALTTLGGMAGPILAGIIGTKFGRAIPIVLGAFTMGAMTLVIVYTGSSMTYAVASVAGCMAMVFALPFLKGLVAHNDPSGKLNAMAMGIYSIAVAVSPMIAGSILLGGGTYRTIGWFVIAVLVLMLALIVGLAIKSVRKQPAL